MADRPILFSGPMVRALLDGRKTQTRRVVKPQHPACDHIADRDEDGVLFMSAQGTHCKARNPYGVPGDRLWVRETWHYINHQNGPRGLEVCIGYSADGDDLPNRPSHLVPDPERWADKVDAWPFKHRRWPAIHMPRWASRISLRIADVRVERLNDISEADAEAEGVQDPSLVPVLGAFWSSRDGYARLWDHINGPGSWDANPWVWVVAFEREEADHG